MLEISSKIHIPLHEIELSAIRAGGPGGQNVNKVSSAIHLRFPVEASSLPDYVKSRLLELKDRRITKDGHIIIKAQRYREQDKNRQDALDRLAALIQKTLHRPKTRIATRPSRTAKRKRVDNKTRRGQVKKLRGSVSIED